MLGRNNAIQTDCHPVDRDPAVTGDSPDTGAAGIRFIDTSGQERLVHEYTEDDYALEDIHDLFGLGSLDSDNDGEVVLVLSGTEIRSLKAMADAQSFDHPADFITMCLDIHGFAAGLGDGPFRFRAIG